jgi:hypothetical protein
MYHNKYSGPEMYSIQSFHSQNKSSERVLYELGWVSRETEVIVNGRNVLCQM